MTPAVSVFCLTYNHERFIGEFIESVLSQSCRDLELIIADDGSTDGSQDIIRRYAAADARVKAVLAPTNKGLIANFNDSIGLCAGRFVVIIGGDDVMLPGKIERQVRYLESHPDCGVLTHDAWVIDEDGRRQYRWSSRHRPLRGGIETQFATNWLLRKDRRIAPPSVMYRKEFLGDVRYDARLPIANEWLQTIESTVQHPGLKWHYLPEVLSQYRRHGRQMSSDAAIGRRNFEERMLVLSIVEQRYPETVRLVRRYREYMQFQYLALDWHEPELRPGYRERFLREAGPVKNAYLNAVHFLLHHPVLMTLSRPVRKLITMTAGVLDR